MARRRTHLFVSIILTLSQKNLDRPAAKRKRPHSLRTRESLAPEIIMTCYLLALRSWLIGYFVNNILYLPSVQLLILTQSGWSFLAYHEST